MTVREFYKMVSHSNVTNLDAELTLKVHCPHGGNSLPVELKSIRFNDDKSRVFFNLSPADGVEYEVFDRDEDEEDEGNDI